MNIPERLKILPYLIPATFEDSKVVSAYTLAPDLISYKEWFEKFIDQIIQASENREFLPVLRVSDGEYQFLLGWQWPSPREKPLRYVKQVLQYARAVASHRGKGFRAATSPGVSSGDYSRREWENGKLIFERGLKFVLAHGILAAHLTLGPRPFQEKYHPAFGKWLWTNGLELNLSNYVPFYQVYQVLQYPFLRELLGGRRILAIHSAKGVSREKISKYLLDCGAASIDWIEISRNKSLFERLKVDELGNSYDLALLGAGVGKFGIIEQLKNLCCPVLDAGYYFVAWEKPELAERRPQVRV